MNPLAMAVVDFWFGPPGAAERGSARQVWFRKDPAFDEDIRGRFGAAVSIALAGGYGDWCADAHGALARVLLLDQFTRNIFRDTPRAFAGDARALATAEDALARGLDCQLDVFGRWFTAGYPGDLREPRMWISWLMGEAQRANPWTQKTASISRVDLTALPRGSDPR